MGAIELHLIAILLGSIAGVVAGVLPGIGILATLTISFPIVSNWPIIDIFIFYAALAQISQFCGSVTTIYTGVAGEPSSVPTITEIKKLPVSSYNELIAATSVSSFVAAVLSIFLCITLVNHLDAISYLLRTEVIAALYIVALVCVVKYSDNRAATSIALTIVGLCLGLVGFNNNLQINILTFGNHQLTSGLPIDVVLLCLFAMPQLYQMAVKPIELINIPIKFKWPTLNYVNTIFYSIVGFIGGLMPGLTMIFSSMLAYNIASVRTPDPRERIIAAETANNAGAVSQLIPLIVFGLPLVASEAIVLGLMRQKGYDPTIPNAVMVVDSTMWLLLGVAAVGMILAWPLATKIIMLMRIKMKVLRAVILSVMVASIFYQAWTEYSMYFTLVTMIALAAAGMVIRNKDTACLIFGYLVAPQLLDYSIRLYNLYT